MAQFGGCMELSLVESFVSRHLVRRALQHHSLPSTQVAANVYIASPPPYIPYHAFAVVGLTRGV